MELEKIVQLFIYTHAGFGGTALLTGAVALIAKKGNKLHKKSGKVFFYSMLTGALISLIISIMPNHQSPFLFSVGVFSMYFLLKGYRSLRFKQKEFDLKLDKLVTYVIIMTGIFMILYPIVLTGKYNIILLVFGVAGIVFGVRDLKSFKDRKSLRSNWLKMHLGNMIGGYISAVTAFFVVNNILPGVWNWFLPGIVGGSYITYWMMKLKKPKAANKSHI
jgi:uncharacterized membrane protein